MDQLCTEQRKLEQQEKASCAPPSPIVIMMIVSITFHTSYLFRLLYFQRWGSETARECGQRQM